LFDVSVVIDANPSFTRFNNPDKGAVGHTIVHKALWEYLQEIKTEGDADAEKKRREVFERYVHIEQS
jgi:hypothetical protein